MAMLGTSRSPQRRRSIIRHGILMLAAFAMLYPLLWMAAARSSRTI